MSKSPRDHRQTWDLIPWIINGTASVADQELVEAHLRQCAECRAELQFQGSIQAAVAAQPQREPHEGWAGLQRRLDDGAALEPLVTAPAAARRAMHALARNNWMGLAAMVVLEALAIGALSMALWSSQRPTRAPVYQTLAANQQNVGDATIRIVLVPTMRLSELQQLLQGTGLQVVGGPTESGVWSLGPAGTANRMVTDAEVRALRANAAVRFAEAVGPSP